jgi:hypothetical protein
MMGIVGFPQTTSLCWLRVGGQVEVEVEVAPKEKVDKKQPSNQDASSSTS